MKNLVSFSFLLIASCVVFSSCKENHDEEISILNTALAGTTDTLRNLQAERVYHESVTDSLQNQIKNIKAQIESDSIKIVDYSSQHKEEIACVLAGFGGAGIKMDVETDYPDIVQEAAVWAVVGSLIYYLGHRDEVNAVVDNLSDADAKKKRLYSEIEENTRALISERDFFKRIDSLISEYEYRVSNVREQIKALQSS